MNSDRYQIKAAANQPIDIMVYGDIGNWWDPESPDAREIVSTLNSAPDQDVNVRISSFGGSYADGAAIFNGLLAHKGKVSVQVDGVAYSMASLIAMAADPGALVMAGTAMMMIHAPHVAAQGNAVKLREIAGVLDQVTAAMEAGYRRSSADKAEIASWLTDGQDHYFTAEQAKAAGLIDQISQSEVSQAIAAAMIGAEQRFTALSTTGGQDMPEDTKAGAGGADSKSFVAETLGNADALKKAGAAAENKRRGEIEAVFEGVADPDGSLATVRAACVADLNCTPGQARKHLIEAMKQRTDIPLPGGGLSADQGAANPGYTPRRESIHMQADAADKLIKGATLGMSIRLGLENNAEVLAKEANNEFVSMTLLELGKHCMRLEGKQVNGDPIRAAGMILGAGGPGQGTSHFPAILENIANKSVMDGYLAAEETWNQWTVRGSLNDFRTASRVNKSLFDLLEKMEENEKFRHGRFADVKQSITGYLHGKSFSLTLQSIVNDDLGILTGDARSWGEAASTTIGNAVFLVLTESGTGGYGQVMDEDGTVLFHASHNNFVDTGSGGAPDKTTIGAGRTAMMSQMDPNGRQVASRPRYLLHGTTLTMDVIQLLNSQNYITGQDVTQGEANPVRSLGLQSVEEYRFDDWVSTAWILAALRRTVEVAFVGGQTAPGVMRMPPGEIPGVSWQISIPFGVAALDYRTMYLNYGA